MRRPRSARCLGLLPLAPHRIVATVHHSERVVGGVEGVGGTGLAQSALKAVVDAGHLVPMAGVAVHIEAGYGLDAFGRARGAACRHGQQRAQDHQAHHASARRAPPPRSGRVRRCGLGAHAGKGVRGGRCVVVGGAGSHDEEPGRMAAGGRGHGARSLSCSAVVRPMSQRTRPAAVGVRWHALSASVVEAGRKSTRSLAHQAKRHRSEVSRAAWRVWRNRPAALVGKTSLAMNW